MNFYLQTVIVTHFDLTTDFYTFKLTIFVLQNKKIKILTLKNQIVTLKLTNFDLITNYFKPETPTINILTNVDPKPIVFCLTTGNFCPGKPKIKILTLKNQILTFKLTNFDLKNNFFYLKT